MPNYILNEDHTYTRCENLMEFANWFKKSSEVDPVTHKPARHVDITIFAGPITVSTVFLGMDHNFNFSGKPILFETMIFGIENDSYQTRCSTWEEAIEMHKKAVKYVKLKKKRKMKKKGRRNEP